MIISIISTKGGTGKSTIALNLAGFLFSNKCKVLLIDADPQKTIGQWGEMSSQEYPEILVEPSPVIHEKINLAVKEYDIIIIDTPPSFRDQMHSVIKSSEKLIIPVSPGLSDIWSTEKLLNIYGKEKENRPNIDIRLLISRVDKRTRLGREFRPFLERLKIPIFKTEISQRTVIAESFIAGMTIDRYQKNGDAFKEFNSLSKEVRQWGKE
jgi:chromosome partitioning protein